MSAPCFPGAKTALQEYLFGLTLHGVKLGLENINILLQKAGNPQHGFPAVHVAGTNGKGSVVACLEAMLRAAGYRTGSFTSPHLIDVSERFQINAEPLSTEALEAHIAFFRDIAETMSPYPTFFEVCTAIAFRAFAEEGVDLGLIEVGMGGRLDSTNVLRPRATAITNIALEHTAYLGDSRVKIAGEKAGIIKRGVPVVVGETDPAVQEVFLSKADDLDAAVLLGGRDYFFQVSGSAWEQSISFQCNDMEIADAPLALVGRFQGDNAAMAMALATTLRSQFPRLDEAAMRQGLKNAQWPCRNEVVLKEPPVLIDVAHNVAGMTRLTELFEEVIAIVAISSDKDAPGMLQALAPIATTLILTEFQGKRRLPLEQLQQAAGTIPHRTAANLEQAIALGMPAATSACPLLITGSIYCAGEARHLLMEHHHAPPLRFR
jgi:dihydrofolate synthase / folylpolyglutamate synthase